ncbi:MAG: alpha/beta hydrolase [Hellea sp.]
MSVSLSHRFFVLLLRLTGGRKILGRQFKKGRSATAAPKDKEIDAYEMTKSEFEGQTIWHYSGNDTLIYYLHGGAFVLGFSPLYFPMMGKIAAASGATLIAPDYPLPPKHTAIQTHEWMRAHFLKTIEIAAPRRVIIMGDSAGANLAIGLANWLSTSGHQAADKLVLIAPWVDLEMQNPDMVLNSGEQLLFPEDLREAALRYAGTMDINDPLISPVHASILELPETHIFTGDKDLLHPDIIRFAAKHPKAKLNVAEEMPHVYMLMPTKEAKTAIARIGEAVNA